MKNISRIIFLNQTYTRKSINFVRIFVFNNLNATLSSLIKYNIAEDGTNMENGEAIIVIVIRQVPVVPSSE